MQSRAIKLRSIFSAITSRTGTPLWARTAKSISRTADPSIHAESPDEVESEEARKSALAEQRQQQQQQQTDENEKQNEEQLKPTTRIASSPSLTSTEVTRPRDPLSQQRRHYSSTSSPAPPAAAAAAAAAAALDEVICAGIDGSPEAKQEGQMRSAEEENREYFKERKASALSNIEMADTRKPIVRATTVRYEGLFGGEKMDFAVVMESAEETFERATRIWKETAMRSWIRDAPHTKVLVDALAGKDEVITDLVQCPITA